MTRLRLGLPPLDDMPDACVLCKEDISSSPWHALSCAKLKRKTVTRRHDRCSQLLCRFARSNDCTAHVVQKDLAHLCPTERSTCSTARLISTSQESTRTLPPMWTCPREQPRSSVKVTKLASMTPTPCRRAAHRALVLDTYGCLAPAALQLIKDIRDEALSSLGGAPNPFRLSRSSFLAELSHAWQFDTPGLMSSG